MYIVCARAHYDSAHALRSYKGKGEKLHGHRYLVEAAVGTEELGEGGMAFDFIELKGHLRAIAEYLDHENLNELPPFDMLETSAENQARYFHDELRRRLPPELRDALLWTRVWETPSQWAQYSDRPLPVHASPSTG
ncbi:MAG TPA: 6-carboxytetrahydropterin synthase [Longimicrobiales bacterium]|nr:6-carboxytetrahydropterin synthase [Longimicrobiales bacterium]